MTPGLRYHLDLRHPERRRVEVTLQLDAQPGMELFLPVWTPGSYLLREYSKHLSDFDLRSTDGEPIAWSRPNKNCLRIDHDGEVVIRYSVYAHELSVRTCDLTDAHAFLTGAAVFHWPRTWTAAEVEIEIQLPEGWRLTSSLSGGEEFPGADGPVRLRANNLDELVDSPILAGDFEVLDFECLGKPHALVMDGMAGIPIPERLVPDTRAVIEAAAAIFGNELPYERYEFQCMFSDSGYGGLEHLASSALLSPRTALTGKKNYAEFMGLVAHEFFHVWNVKRMRPQAIWEFDYEQENYTELLWVAEGFTAYYDDHICLRAGILDPRSYLERIGKSIHELRRTPGRFRQSLSEASFDAWIRLYRPDEDSRNSTLSYYDNGALAALCIDLQIRSLTQGSRSLDDAVRELYARSYQQGRGYTAEDVHQSVSKAAGQDLSEQIRELTEQPLDPDFAMVLSLAGLRIREDNEELSPYLGVHFKGDSTKLAVVLNQGPAEQAGLMPGDEILAMNSLRVTGSNWSQLFKQLAEVDTALDLLLNRRGRILERRVRPQPRPSRPLNLVVDEGADAAAVAVRESWLGNAEI